MSLRSNGCALFCTGLALLSCGGLIEENESILIGEDGDLLEPPSRSGVIPPPAKGAGGEPSFEGMGGGAARSSGGFSGMGRESTGGAGGAGTGGGGGTGGESGPNIDCTGAFEESTVLFQEDGWIPQALAPTRDGLELFYARLAYDLTLDMSGQRRLMVRTRASLDDDYSEGRELSELDGICEVAEAGTEPTSLDVSGDALRLYVGCTDMDDGSYPPGPLLLATRPDRESRFVVQREPIGFVGFSLGLSKDELEAFGASPDPSITEILYYSRSTKDEPFGPVSIVPGAVALGNPEPAADGLTLLGVTNYRGGGITQIAVSTREEVGAPFSEPSTEGMPVPPSGYNDYSPALGTDCRTLYFLRFTSIPEFDAAIMVAKR